MAFEHDLLGSEIVDWLIEQNTDFERDKLNPSIAHIASPHFHENLKTIAYNLCPVDLPLEVADAGAHFSQVQSIDDLITQYWAARQSHVFEHDIPTAMDNIHPWADEFLGRLIASANEQFSNHDAQLIAQFVSMLDVYAAVKTIESLLNNPQDMTLLRLAHQNKWQVHLDHISIRCGSQKSEDAERIFNFLMKHHHYYPPQQIEEAYLMSTQGWNAYPLYKIMQNGQMIRIFIDQADSEHQQQVIQQWNHAYGYTAHQIGLRISQQKSLERTCLPLPTLINELQQQQVTVLNGDLAAHTLLQKLSIKPINNNNLPSDLQQAAARAKPDLTTALMQGKLISLVSRLELPNLLKQKWFKLYQIAFEPGNPVHSAPAFNLFTPIDTHPVLLKLVESSSF